MDLDEPSLVIKAKQGDRRALEQLLSASYSMVYGYLLKMSRDEELSKDLTQEVMVKAIVNISHFRGNSKFSTWLVSMAVNLYKDSLKKKQATPVDFTQEPLMMQISSPSAETVAISHVESERLMQVIHTLPENQRQTFILKHFYQMSYETIAQMTNSPIGTVRSRLHNGVKRIQEAMGKGDL